MEINVRYLKETEVATLTGMALSTLRNNRSLGRGIKYCKINRSVRYSLRDVVDYMESHKVELGVRNL